MRLFCLHFATWISFIPFKRNTNSNVASNKFFKWGMLGKWLTMLNETKIELQVNSNFTSDVNLRSFL